MLEYILPMAIAFAITAMATPFFIGYLKKREVGQTTREEGPSWHNDKSGTPTMGGTVFLLSILLVLFFSAWMLNLLDTPMLMILLTLFLFGGIGFVDDYISIYKQQNEGLTARQKFLAQLIFAILVIGIGLFGQLTLYIPFGFADMTLPVLVLLFGVVWIVGFSNAVNLTDGLDGLATGQNIIAYSAYFYLAIQSNEPQVALACLVVVGSLLGFIIFNKKPAKIFMGDVGSLALGAGLATISLILNNPWSLLIIGIIFVIETLSVILQVLSFKLRGKRIFKMSPIHHHFELSGWPEARVTTTFWLVGLVAALLFFYL